MTPASHIAKAAAFQVGTMLMGAIVLVTVAEAFNWLCLWNAVRRSGEKC